MPDPSISVAMCTYNGEQYLQAQLDSYVRQTMRPHELIICDDASTDRTQGIIAAFARTAPFMVHIHCQSRNIGRIGNFETAIALCSKDIIFLSDQDDVWHSNKIERMAGALWDAPAASGIFCDAEIVDAALRPLGYSHWEHRRFTPNLQSRLRNGDAYESLLRSHIVQGAALAFRTSYRALLLPLSRQWGHNSWIAVLLAAVGDLVAVDEKLMSYRQHGANLVGAVRTKPRRLERWMRKVREPKQHYQSALGVVTNFLNQMDDLQERLVDWPEPARSQKLLEAISYRRMKLNRRKRIVELVYNLLKNSPPKHDRSRQELPPPR